MRASDRKLHDALKKAGLHDLADRAADSEWNDYFGKHELPQHALVAELRARASADPSLQRNCERLVRQVIEGEFDGTREESDEWASSEEGQRVMDELAQTPRGQQIVGEAVTDALREARESIITAGLSDPRELKGGMIGGEDVILDDRKAVLVDSIDVCKVNEWSQQDHLVFGLLVGGRINKSRDRANVLLMGDLDFMAAVITQMHGVAERAGVGEELKELCQKRWAEMPR
jgi:hypothetical protein